MKRAGQPSREGLAVSINPVDRNVLDLNRQIDEEEDMAYLQDQVVGLIEGYIAENGHLDHVAYPADLAKTIVDGIVSKSGYDPARRYAVVELPKPKYREPHGYGYSNENAHLSDWGVFACTEDGCVYDQNDGVSPEDAWTIGSWWLAASRCITERDVAAERDSEGGE